MPSETGITSILGVEKTSNKNQPGGYPELDGNGFIPMYEQSYLSVIPTGVIVSGFIPFLDDAITYLYLIYLESGYYISFNDSTECFNMVKI
jgi:hypothetical protein